MNILRSTIFRQSVHFPLQSVYACRRSYATATFERDSNEDRRPERQAVEKPIPDSPNFYTTRAVYFDQLMQLEKATGSAETFLRQHHLIPLPEFAKASLPPAQTVWKKQEDMESEFQTKMTTTRYRRVTKLLNQLNEFERIASTGGVPELADQLRGILEMYESSKKDAYLARGKRKVVILDEFGRSYTVGKRKTSSARVWMIPVRQPEPSENSEESKLLPPKPTIPTTTVLINNMPLNQYFPISGDREKVTRPFKVAGNLGKYNVFAIVRGGGLSGQAGAVAHGISKGIVAHEPELETMFRRAKLTYRDPRMVERKKTGLAKARKRYTWVKR